MDRTYGIDRPAGLGTYGRMVRGRKPPYVCFWSMDIELLIRRHQRPGYWSAGNLFAKNPPGSRETTKMQQHGALRITSPQANDQTHRRLQTKQPPFSQPRPPPLSLMRENKPFWQPSSRPWGPACQPWQIMVMKITLSLCIFGRPPILHPP